MASKDVGPPGGGGLGAGIKEQVARAGERYASLERGKEVVVEGQEVVEEEAKKLPAGSVLKGVVSGLTGAGLGLVVGLEAATGGAAPVDIRQAAAQPETPMPVTSPAPTETPSPTATSSPTETLPPTRAIPTVRPFITPSSPPVGEKQPSPSATPGATATLPEASPSAVPPSPSATSTIPPPEAPTVTPSPTKRVEKPTPPPTKEALDLEGRMAIQFDAFMKEGQPDWKAWQLVCLDNVGFIPSGNSTIGSLRGTIKSLDGSLATAIDTFKDMAAIEKAVAAGKTLFVPGAGATFEVIDLTNPTAGPTYVEKHGEDSNTWDKTGTIKQNGFILGRSIDGHPTLGLQINADGVMVVDGHFAVKRAIVWALGDRPSDWDPQGQHANDPNYDPKGILEDRVKILDASQQKAGLNPNLLAMGALPGAEGVARGGGGGAGKVVDQRDARTLLTTIEYRDMARGPRLADINPGTSSGPVKGDTKRDIRPSSTSGTRHYNV
jgi:hypothetical protein